MAGRGNDFAADSSLLILPRCDLSTAEATTALGYSTVRTRPRAPTSCNSRSLASHVDGRSKVLGEQDLKAEHGQDPHVSTSDDGESAASVAVTHHGSGEGGGSQSPAQSRASDSPHIPEGDGQERAESPADEQDEMCSGSEAGSNSRLENPARVFPRRKRGEAHRQTDKPVTLTTELLSVHYDKTLREASKALVSPSSSVLSLQVLAGP